MPCSSKLLERIIYNTLYEFVTKNEILYKKNSLDSRLLTLQTSPSLRLLIVFQIFMKMVRFKLGLHFIFINFSKAFNLVDHTILLHKLNRYGIKGKYYDWFKFYFNKQQLLSNNEEISPLRIIRCRVPQESILESLLYLIFQQICLIQ